MAIGAIWGEIWNEAIWNTAIWSQVAVEPEPEPEATQKPAGRPRRRYVVEIDGQDFQVSSIAEVSALLSKARELASEAIEQARTKAPLRIRPGIKRPVIRTRDPELRPLVQQAAVDITSLFDRAARDLEIAALMAKRIEDEEEEALIRLLM